MAEILSLQGPLDGLRRSAARLHRRGRALARAYPRETIGLGVFGFVTAVAVGSAIVPNPAAPAAHAAAPAPPPLILRQVAPDEALKLNAQIPFAGGSNPAAAPFAFRGSADARTQALQCLASAIYYEAGNQDENGARAVAQVVLNRVRHPAFPASVCGVVYEGSTRTTGCQFTFTCDGSLARAPGGDIWRRAYRIAEQALSGSVYAPVGWATHYHADYVLPTWASSMAKNAVIGAHIFYRWNGGWGRPDVFTEAYAGREPNAAALKTAALAVPHIVSKPQVAEAIDEIPGAEAIDLSPSMRGDKRVAVRFNLAARKASEDAVHVDYTKKFETSDNLSWSLSSATVASDQQPLGKSASAGSSSGRNASGGAGAAAQR